ncbi:hypothetical protein HMPREF1531_00490 [Propionibacterium sp. oral taxon 192 str. F0372]|uniref:hypothetical protein n=1 Tax=Propionibacterium sp. oral taxon 192 TaxID=671222 RepID=UPI000354355D|nr:hypothetical protein [Propionibacterium sp. oral taxon 192]EPH06589.1 hypothetical protein HMPREF1531_00490 [Propionibacterium sp. oral taxon 192 str. F0372]
MALFGSDSSSELPSAPIGYEWAEVMVTVKTYPTPSVRHVETVCVAGVRLDQDQSSWIRLYPIPFRLLGGDDQFKKYQLVTVPVRHRPGHDARPESFTPDLDNIRLGETVKSDRNWARRAERMQGLIGQATVCELIRANRDARMNEPAPSLGLIKPRDVTITVTDGKGWTAKQEAKAAAAAEPTLLDEYGAVPTKLEPAPYEIRFKYRCQDRACRGHDQALIDWEVGAAARNWVKRYPADSIPYRLENKWKQMIDPAHDTYFYVGNQHQHRQSFSVLGVWAPKL